MIKFKEKDTGLIDVGVTLTWAMLTAMSLSSLDTNPQSITATLVLANVISFLTMSVHELGHAIPAILLGHFRNIRVSPIFAGVALNPKTPEIHKNIIVAFGPLALSFLGLLIFTPENQNKDVFSLFPMIQLAESVLSTKWNRHLKKKGQKHDTTDFMLISGK